MGQTILEMISSEEEVNEEEVGELKGIVRKTVDDSLDRVRRSELEKVITDKDSFTRKDLDGQDPEEFTRKYIIDPLLEHLGYDPRRSEFAGDVGGDTPDYKFETDEGPLLAEAKQVGKISNGEGDMRTYLNRKDLESDYGMVTDGINWTLMKWQKNEINSVSVKLGAVFLDSLDQKHFGEEESRIKEFLATFKKELIFEKADKATVKLREKKKEITKEFFDRYIKMVFGKSGSYSLLNAIDPPHNYEEKDLRLFVVGFMNKLLFIKFLEDKNIVQTHFLEDLWGRYQKSDSLGTFYKDTLEPLFFSVMNAPKDNRNRRIKSDELLSSVPYLNGGLFRTSVSNEKSYDIENSIIGDIIEDLIKKYSFTLGSEDESLDPSILGKVFEKTINYLTSKEEKDEKKEKGAYYTPDDVTSYISPHSLKPCLYDRIREELTQDYGYSKTEFENLYGDFDAILENPPKKPVMRKIHEEVIKNVKILDAGCGSGHILTSVLKELFWIRKSFCERFEIDYTNDQQLIEEIIKNNIYGVDVEESAVEITKLRLWLSILDKANIGEDEIDKLPDIEYNIRAGNTLIGFVREVGEENKIVTHTLRSQLEKYWRRISRYREGKVKNPVQIKEDIKELSSDMNGNLNEWYAKESKAKIEGTFEERKEFEKIITNTGIKGESKKVVIVKDSDNDEEFTKPEKRVLSDLGFRAYKHKARRTLTKKEVGVEENKQKLLDDFRSLFKKIEFEKGVFERETCKNDIEEVGFFHWIMEFEEVLKQGGFDLVIGNPPYGQGVLSEKEKALLNDWESAGCGDICGYFLEREIQLVKEGGYVSNIIADSLGVNNSMTKVRDLMREKGCFELAFFGTRPTRIFDTVEERVCIITGKIDYEGEDIKTSKNIRFTKDMRDELFDNLQYETTKGLILGSKIGVRENQEDTRLPKIGSKENRKVLESLKRHNGNTLKDIMADEGPSLDLRTSAGYWINALKEFPYSSSKIKELKFSNELDRNFALLLLNSSLFYFYWSVYGNNRDVFSNLVKAFPIAKENLKENGNKIKKLANDIDECLNACFNPEVGRKGEFRTERCKEKIDEIDEFLKDLYGFSDELVEHIKSYDSHIRPSSEND